MSKIKLHPATNLFTLEVDAYAHGCNTLGLMGSGIAKQFRDRDPAMTVAYKEVCKNAGYNESLLGGFFFWDKSTPMVYNLFTQFQPGRHPKNEYDKCLLYVGTCFANMFADAANRGLNSIGMPCIGAGIYRLEWDDVFEELIQAYDSMPWDGTVHIAMN